MKRIRCIIALALVVTAQTAAKADSYFMNATAHVISLTFVNGGIEERREQKSFDTYNICLAWKHQQEFLPPHPPAFLSFVYCERTEVRLNAVGTAVDFQAPATTDPGAAAISGVVAGQRPGWFLPIFIGFHATSIPCGIQGRR